MVSDIPAGDGKIYKLFYSVYYGSHLVHFISFQMYCSSHYRYNAVATKYTAVATRNNADCRSHLVYSHLVYCRKPPDTMH